MRIRDRLTYTLSITAFLSITILGVMVYIFTARFHEREFFEILDERAALAEKIFLENDEELEAAVRERFLQQLDEEEEYALTFGPSGLDSLSLMFPSNFVQKIQQQERAQFWQGNRQGVGIRYRLPKGEYVVVVTAVDTFGARKLDFLRNILLLGGLLAVVSLVWIDRMALSRALKPLENTIQKASSITADRLDLRLNIRNPEDEIGKVARAFNGVLDRLQNSFEAQKLFVRNASHEIRNPLTAISGEAEVLLNKERSPAEYQEALTTILKESDRLQILINKLLELEKTDALSSVPDPEVFSLDEAVLEAVDQFSPGKMILEFESYDAEPQVLGSRHLMHTAIGNLIDNALKYSDNKPVRVCLASFARQHQIRIIDSGIGIPHGDLDKIFQPFFRSENARGEEGHGIGLSLVKKIVDLHGGEIQYASTSGKGTAMEILLPVYVENS